MIDLLRTNTEEKEAKDPPVRWPAAPFKTGQAV
jgi:hypothetical protein